MKLLVVGSCTGEKDVRDCPSLLTETDFDDLATLPHREAELSPWALPAAKLYMGWQHRYMMKGVGAIRQKFGSAVCVLKIISAGYGLVEEDRNLVPYEATFRHKRSTWIKERAQRLGIPQALRQAIRDFEAVVFLLGKEYLIAVHPSSLDSVRTQRRIFLAPNTSCHFTQTQPSFLRGWKRLDSALGWWRSKGKCSNCSHMGYAVDQRLGTKC